MYIFQSIYFRYVNEDLLDHNASRVDSKDLGEDESGQVKSGIPVTVVGL